MEDLKELELFEIENSSSIFFGKEYDPLENIGIVEMF